MTNSARLRRRGTAGILALAAGLGLGLLGPAASAQAMMRPATHYIVFVNYYSDATLTVFVGTRTFDDCPGEQGSYGYGTQTSYYTITSEACG